MQVLCDVHISYKIVRFFEKNGIHAIHVNSILQGSETADFEISLYADNNDFVVVSKDSDFQAAHFLNNKPKKLLKIGLGNLSTRQTIAILQDQLTLLISSFEKEPCFVEIGRDYVHIID